MAVTQNNSNYKNLTIDYEKIKARMGELKEKVIIEQKLEVFLREIQMKEEIIGKRKNPTMRNLSERRGKHS